MLKRILGAMLGAMLGENRTGPGRVNFHVEITTENPPPGITSGRLAEIAVLVLRGENSPLREVLAPGPGNGWERQRDSIQVEPYPRMGKTQGVTVNVAVTLRRALSESEATALGETVHRRVNNAVAEAAGFQPEGADFGEKTGENSGENSGEEREK